MFIKGFIYKEKDTRFERMGEKYVIKTNINGNELVSKGFTFESAYEHMYSSIRNKLIEVYSMKKELINTKIDIDSNFNVIIFSFEESEILNIINNTTINKTIRIPKYLDNIGNKLNINYSKLIRDYLEKNFYKHRGENNVKNIFYVEEGKICTDYRKIIFNISDYGLILSIGVENLYIYIISEENVFSYGILELFEDKFRAIPTNFNCLKFNKDSVMESIIENTFVDGHFSNILNDPIKMEVLILMYIEKIMDLKPRGDRGHYVFEDTVIKDIKENEYSHIFHDTFKKEFY
ncbi:hypothetical protein I9Y31_003290 [Clostridium perfringens]|nr:hypothetical protein [Clostridium perfringens]